MARKKPHEEHENHERYILTYADLITLLLAFFIILYAMSSTDEGKFKEVARSLRLGFLPHAEQSNLFPTTLEGSHARTPTTQEDIDYMRALQDNNNLLEIKEKIDGNIRENPDLLSKIKTELTEDGLYIILSDEILFDSGSAVLKPDSEDILHFTSEVISGIQNPIKISGHTDNVPIATSRFPSNWELSTARATATLQEMIEELPENEIARYAATGYGEYKPRAENETSEGRKVNRRVEILVERLFHNPNQ